MVVKVLNELLFMEIEGSLPH